MVQSAIIQIDRFWMFCRVVRAVMVVSLKSMFNSKFLSIWKVFLSSNCQLMTFWVQTAANAMVHPSSISPKKTIRHSNHSEAADIIHILRSIIIIDFVLVPVIGDIIWINGEHVQVDECWYPATGRGESFNELSFGLHQEAYHWVYTLYLRAHSNEQE